MFFGGISQHSRGQFEAAVASVSEEAYAADLAAQCHRNAQIARLKFAWVHGAFVCLYLALTPWCLALYVLYGARR